MHDKKGARLLLPLLAFSKTFL